MSKFTLNNFPVARTKDFSIAKCLFSSFATWDYQNNIVIHADQNNMVIHAAAVHTSGFRLLVPVCLSSFVHIPISDNCIPANDIEVYCHSLSLALSLRARFFKNCLLCVI